MNTGNTCRGLSDEDTRSLAGTRMAMERLADTSAAGIHLEGGVRERSEIAYLHLPLGLSKIERFGLEGKLAPQLRHNCQSTAPQLFRSCPAKPHKPLFFLLFGGNIFRAKRKKFSNEEEEIWHKSLATGCYFIKKRQDKQKKWATDVTTCLFRVTLYMERTSCAPA